MPPYITPINNLLHRDIPEGLEAPIFTRGELIDLIYDQSSFQNLARGTISKHISKAFAGDKRLDPHYIESIELAIKTKFETSPDVATAIITQFRAIATGDLTPQLRTSREYPRTTHEEYETLIGLGFSPVQIERLRTRETLYHSLVCYLNRYKRMHVPPKTWRDAMLALGGTTPQNEALLNKIMLEPTRGTFMRTMEILKASR